MRKRLIGILVFGLIMALALPAIILASNSKAPRGNIEGEVFYDRNQNGAPDLFECPIRYMEIKVNKPGGDKQYSTITGSNGRFVISGLKPGSYVVSAQEAPIWSYPPPWSTTINCVPTPDMVSTSPNPAKIILKAKDNGMNKIVNFGFWFNR